LSFMFYGEGEIVSGHQCVRTHRSLGNVYTVDLCPDGGRVGLLRTCPLMAVSFTVAAPRSARILEEKLNAPQTLSSEKTITNKE
jgi:hypothetical protein